MGLYPDNMVSQWKTKLSEFIEFKDKWGVGLKEALFPGKVKNIFRDTFSFTVQVGLHIHMCMLTWGICHTIQTVMLEIRRAYGNARVADQEELVQFRIHSSSRRMSVIFTEHAQQGTTMIFNEDLAVMLGFRPRYAYWFNGVNSELRAKKPVLHPMQTILRKPMWWSTIPSAVHRTEHRSTLSYQEATNSTSTRETFSYMCK